MAKYWTLLATRDSKLTYKSKKSCMVRFENKFVLVDMGQNLNPQGAMS